MKYSIVIPTYNHCDDLLKPCIESIVQYTDMDNVELIVVANGCKDNTKEYMDSVVVRFPQTKFIWIPEAAGFTKATNEGIKVATGEYVVLLNNDTELLPQAKNSWLQILEAPFEKQLMGMTGPLELFDRYANAPVLIFFCVMIRKTVFDTIGLCDEIFSPGGGEDVDFSVRLRAAGFETQAVSTHVYTGATNTGEFPIWHKDNRTFTDIPEYTNWIIKRNGLINCKRYNKDIRLNVGAGPIEVPGYLSLDLYDKRANILMDVTNLEFDENSVSEILASHVFEHLNPNNIDAMLKNWFTVLKPGGKLIMEMPDIEALCYSFNKADTGLKYGLLNAVYGSVNTNGIGGPDNITSPHLYGWSKDLLQDSLTAAGFGSIDFMAEQIPHPGDNLRVEAMKLDTTFKALDHTRLKAEEPEVYAEVFEQNGYFLQDSDVRGKTVIDCGANVGYFSLQCAERGAKKIIAVEAQPTVYKLGLLRNTADYPMIKTMNAAVYSEDGKQLVIENKHVGSSVAESGTGEATPSITLATLVKNLVGNDLILKIDVEGAEYNAIMPATEETMRRFSSIHIEIHGSINPAPEYRGIETLRAKLRSFGFIKTDTVQMYSGYFTEGGGKVLDTPMDVVVDKWIRSSIVPSKKFSKDLPTVLIHGHAQNLPNGKMNAKNYPWWDELLAALPANIIQVGTSKDADLTADVRKNLPLKEIQKLIRECDYWISVDSFLPHLAQYENKPGVVLWSLSDPNIFGYKDNLNLLKDRAYLRKDQFNLWDNEPHNPDAFLRPEEVIARIAAWRQ